MEDFKRGPKYKPADLRYPARKASQDLIQFLIDQGQTVADYYRSISPPEGSRNQQAIR